MIAFSIPWSLAAQVPVRFALGPTVAEMRVHSRLPGGTETLSAAGFGAEGMAVVWRFALRARYLRGDLEPTAPTTIPREAVEARVLLGVRIAPWLSLATGPHVRSFATPIGTQRWSLWEVEIRGAPSIVPNVIRGYAELWRVVAADVNVPEEWNSGHGGDAGMLLSLPRLPLWLRIGYRIEVFTLGDGTRRETTDGLTVSAGIGRHR